MQTRFRILERKAVKMTRQEKVRHALLNCKGSFTQAIFVAQFNAVFVALKLQLQNRACKPATILLQFITAV